MTLILDGADFDEVRVEVDTGDFMTSNHVVGSFVLPSREITPAPPRENNCSRIIDTISQYLVKAETAVQNQSAHAYYGLKSVFTYVYSFLNFLRS